MPKVAKSLIPLAVALFSPALWAIKSTSSEFYESALQYHYKGENKAAVIELKNALQQDFNNVSARMLLGKIYLDNGEAAAAEKEFRIAMASGVDPTLVAFELGKALYALSRFKEVIESIQATGKDETLDAEIHLLRGSAYSQLNLNQEAKLEFQQSLLLVPNYPAAIVAMMGTEMAIGNLAQAKQGLEAIPELDKSANAWFMLAEIARLQDDWVNAKAAYMQALSLDSKHIDSLHILVEHALQMGDVIEAELRVTALEQAWPNDPLTQYYRALLLLRQQKHREAEVILSSLTQTLSVLDKTSVLDNYQLSMISAVSYYLLEQPEKARASINPLLYRNPNNVDLAVMLAELDIEDGNFFTAQSLLEKWRDQQVDNIRYYWALGTAYAKQQRYQDAEEILNIGLKHFPDSTALHKTLAASYAYQGKTAEAVQVLQASTTTNAPDAQLMLGYMLLDEGQISQALQLAKQLTSRSEVTLAERNFYAACLMNAGDLAAAQSHFSDILQQEQDFIPALINQARIYAQQAQYAQAEQSLLHVLKIAPNELTAAEILVDIYAYQAKYSQADEVLSFFLQPQFEQSQILKRLIALNLQANNYAKLKHYITELDKAEPLSAYVLEAKIKLAIGQGNVADAKRSARALFGLSLNKPAKLIELIDYQLAIEDADGVKRTIDRLVRLKHTDKIQLAQAQYTYLSAGKDAGLAELERIRLKVPALKWLSVKADIHFKEQEFQLALKAVEAQLKIEPRDEFVKQRISLLRKLGRYDDAITFVSMVIRDNPKRLEYREIKADLLVLNQQPERALAELQAMLTIEPNDAKLLNNLANHLAESAPQQALIYIQQAYEIAPKQPQVLDTFGKVLIALMRYDESLTYLRQAYLLAPRQAEINYHLAQALTGLNREVEAKVSLNKAKQYAREPSLKSKINELARQLK